MKREIPILLTVLCGLLIVWAFFTPEFSPETAAPGEHASISKAVNSELLVWTQILIAVAFLLGIANLVRINLKQVAAGHPDRPYKILLLVSMFGFLLFGMADIHADDLPAGIVATLVPSDRVRLPDGREVQGWALGQEEGVAHVLLEDGLQRLDVPAAGTSVVADRSFKLWVFDKIFTPLQATMFSLLAFYVASAAFRAFRARSLEATLLLVAGAVVMLGQVPLGDALTGGYASRVLAFLMEYVNGAGQRAIVIGGALGMLATGLRIVLGIERSYLSE